MNPLVKPGDVIRLEDPDYRYGIGPLTLRVMDPPSRMDDPEWVEIRGVEIFSNGVLGAVRVVSVRLSALRDPRSRR